MVKTYKMKTYEDKDKNLHSENWFTKSVVVLHYQVCQIDSVSFFLTESVMMLPY